MTTPTTPLPPFTFPNYNTGGAAFPYASAPAQLQGSMQALPQTTQGQYERWNGVQNNAFGLAPNAWPPLFGTTPQGGDMQWQPPWNMNGSGFNPTAGTGSGAGAVPLGGAAQGAQQQGAPAQGIDMNALQQMLQQWTNGSTGGIPSTLNALSGAGLLGPNPQQGGQGAPNSQFTPIPNGTPNAHPDSAAPGTVTPNGSIPAGAQFTGANGTGPMSTINPATLTSADKMYLQKMLNIPGIGMGNLQNALGPNSNAIINAVQPQSYDPAAMASYNPASYNGPLKAMFNTYLQSSPNTQALVNNGYGSLLGQMGYTGNTTSSNPLIAAGDAARAARAAKGLFSGG